MRAVPMETSMEYIADISVDDGCGYGWTVY